MPSDDMRHVLAALTPPNRLVMSICLATGARLSDVLSLRTDRLKERMTVVEMKTGKNRRVRIPKELYERSLAQAGRFFVFAHRTDPKQHRTRQAVWHDVKRAARAFRVDINLAPHSARKAYAVDLRQSGKTIEQIQHDMGHADSAVTLIYALADSIR